MNYLKETDTENYKSNLLIVCQRNNFYQHFLGSSAL